MDIYTRLKTDHRRQKEMAARILETSGDTEERAMLWERFRSEVQAHANAEEQVFYAELLNTPEGQDKARHSISEHKAAADLIDELNQLDKGSGGWLQKFKKLKEELEHHVDEEESEVFEVAAQVLEQTQTDDMTSAFEARKEAETGQ